MEKDNGTGTDMATAMTRAMNKGKGTSTDMVRVDVLIRVPYTVNSPT